MPSSYSITANLLQSTLQGQLFYNRAQYSFDFEPMSRSGVRRRTGDLGTTSVLIGTLQIEIGVETGTLLYVWGYHPHNAWRHSKLLVPNAQPGMVEISLQEPPEPGVSIGLVEDNDWATTYDHATGWICIGDTTPGQSTQWVEFATNTIAVMSDDQFRALWLRPIIQ